MSFEAILVQLRASSAAELSPTADADMAETRRKLMATRLPSLRLKRYTFPLSHVYTRVCISVYVCMEFYHHI